MYTRIRMAKRVMALAMALLLLISCASALESASMQTQAGSQNGMVRVYLSSLGSPSTLNITVAGSYSINGSASLASGSKVTVGFSSATGRLTLTRGGVQSDMGTFFQLRRHATDGTNGLRIAQARVPGNLYPGDLTFTSQYTAGTYRLYVIAYIYIEDYLYGVLPYEMGNSSPIEALKAQAVTARTYTVRAMNASGSRLYDVVDTTSDQVYSGTPSGNANCVAAVNATEGVISKNGSAYTATYYTGSNGGQIESVRNLWGSTAYPYITVKDDPYDYANPSSRVKAFTVQANGAQSQTLAALLNAKAATYFGVPSATVTAVSNVYAHTPKYSSPSRLYTKLDFSVTATVYGTSRTGVLTFDIFQELETKLGMSINSGNNELWSVLRTQTGFTVQVRRYGHGTGMSQRGAEQMAKQGYGYPQIMAFYFEGCTLYTINFTKSILSAAVSGQTSQGQTSGTTSDVPDTSKGEYYATVNSTASTLNMRYSPSLTGGLITEIARGEKIIITAYGADWCAMRYRGLSGYVMTKYLLFTQNAPTTAPTTVPQAPSGQVTARVVTRSGSLNLRKSPSKSAGVYLTIPQDEVVPVYSRGADWCGVTYAGYSGYVMTEFLSFTAAVATAKPTVKPVQTAAPASGQLTARVTTASGSLNLRSEARRGTRVLTTIPRGTVVTVISRGSEWSGVIYDNLSGYVMNDYLTFLSSGSATQAPVVTQKPVVTQAPASGATSATVTTASGSLNLRENPWMGAKVLTTIPQGAVISIPKRGAAWCETSWQGYSGYVMTAYLTFAQVVSPEAPTAPVTNNNYNNRRDASMITARDSLVAQVNSTSSSLNLRRGCDIQADFILEMPRGEYILVIARGDTWCHVQYEGQEGFCMTKYLYFPND